MVYMMATLAFNEFSELKQINQLPCLLKLSENVRFSDDFRENKM